MKTGELIKKARMKKGLTQAELAKKLGYSIPQFISLIENGHSKVPLSIVKELVNILKIPKSSLIKALIVEYKKEVDKAFLVKKYSISKAKKTEQSYERDIFESEYDKDDSLFDWTPDPFGNDKL